MYSLPSGLNSFKHRKDKLSFVDSEQRKDRLCCVLCRDLLIEPHQTQCGCRFCYGCIESLHRNDVRTCPGCGDVVSSMMDKITIDRAIEKEIFVLRMICTNRPCEYKCELQNLGKHLMICEYREEVCVHCGESFVHKEREKHSTRDCKMAKVECSDCGQMMTRIELENRHRNIEEEVCVLCDKWKTVCPYKCSDIVHDSVKEHLGSCVNLPVNCVMKEAGCTVKLSRSEMVEHVRTGAPRHLLLMMNIFRLLRTENADIKCKLSEQTRTHNLELELLTRTLRDNTLEVTALERKLLFCEELHDRLHQHSPLPRNSEQCGEYRWSLTDIAGKITDAKNGKNVQIVSDSFYTAVPGYNLSLKIYPNGDGSACGSSLSVYFVITKGIYDDRVSWPFKHKVSLSLLTGERGTVERTINMKPDTNANCYGKPQSQYNLAAGQPNFISHKDLFKSSKSLGSNSVTLFVKVS